VVKSVAADAHQGHAAGHFGGSVRGTILRGPGSVADSGL
jgi:hypothetical protein